MKTPLITCEQWIAVLIWISVSDECIYSSFIAPEMAGFVRRCIKKLVSAHAEKHRGTNAYGKTTEVFGPGHFQAHYK